MGCLTYDQKKALHEMLYYRVAAELRRMGVRTKPNAFACYREAARRANYCLEALGEKLYED